jgi:PA-IL-like protein
MFKRTILAAATVLALVVSTQAQENATLVLRSGEKVSGQLVDMGGTGFTVRVNGQERQIGTNDVSVIDFTGNGDVSDADLNRVSGGAQTVFLRNGQAIDGQLYDIAGTSPLRITLKTSSGERDLSSSEIGRIVLSRPSNSVATSGSSPSTSNMPEGTGIAVPGNASWTPTGLTVRRGDRLTFSATGEVRLSSDSADVANPNGSRAGRKVASAPVPDAAAGALVAKVGNSAAFPIGENQTVAMPANGQLFLGINDDHVGDNAGGYRVTVQRTNSRR